MNFWQKINTNLNAFLFKSVSASSIAYLRIIIGFALIYIFRDSFHLYFINHLLHSKYLVTYDLFHWIKPLPIFWFNILFYLLYISAFLFAIGYKYRINAIIIFLGFTYCFLMDKGHYNNHYYLYSILLFMFTWVDANRYLSIDAFLARKKGQEMPENVYSWQIWIFRLQFFIVYFYGGIAKLHWDWLKGFPMRFWLYDNSVKFTGFISDFLKTEFAALFFSYSGIVFDLSIGFLLLNKKTRKWALIPLFGFHFTNHFLWNIGTFPWVMILTTPIFFSDSFFKNTINRIKKLLNLQTTFDEKERLNLISAAWKKRLTVVLFVIWFSVQSLLPFRQYYFEGHPSWTGQGHLFAWRMMLVDTLDAIKIQFHIPSTGDTFNVGFENYLNFRQFRKLSRTPMNVIKFNEYLCDEFRKNNPNLKFETKIIIWKSVNERVPKLLTDTTINYANYPFQPFKSQDCFTDWSELDVEPTFNMMKYDNWKKVIENTPYE